MSRGPGKWQRAVLDAAAEAVDSETGFTEWVSVEQVAHVQQGQRLEVDHHDYTGTRILSVGDGVPGNQAQHLPASDREAVRRAMRTLAKKDQVELGKVRQYQPIQQDWEDSPYWSRTVERWVLAVRSPAPIEQQIAEAEVRVRRYERLSGLADFAERAAEEREYVEELKASRDQ